MTQLHYRHELMLLHASELEVHLPSKNIYAIQEPKGSPRPLDFGAGAALPNPT